MNLRRFGDGPIKLVAIHGLGSAGTAWTLLQRHLDPSIELITIDLPGHGDSTIKATSEMTPAVLAEMVHAELKAAQLSSFHLIGNSLGGWVSLEMAAKFPESVLSVTALAPAGLWLEPRTHRNSLLSFNRILAKLIGNQAKRFVKYEMARRIGFQAVSPRWKSLSLDTCLDAANAMNAASGYFEIWDATFGNRFDKPIRVDIPVTVIFGDSDRTLPAKDCQERSLVPAHSFWVVLTDTGHAPMWDNMEEVRRLTYETIERAREDSNL